MESGIRRRQKKLPGYEAHFPVKEGKVKSELALQGAPVQRLLARNVQDLKSMAIVGKLREIPKML